MPLQQQFQRLAQKYPIRFAISVFVAQHLPLIGVFLFQIVAPATPTLLQRLMLQLGLTVYAIVLLTFLNCWRSAGFNSPEQWKSVNLLWFPLLLLALYLCNNTQPINGQALFVSLLAQFITGFTEEAICRGVILQTLLPIGIMQATLLTSLLFGLSHWILLLFGLPLVSVLLTVISATIDGVFFAALRLRTNTIWTAILIHMIGNTIGDIAVLPQRRAIALSITLSVALFIYALYLIRSSKRSLILRWNKQNQVLQKGF